MSLELELDGKLSGRDRELFDATLRHRLAAACEEGLRWSWTKRQGRWVLSFEGSPDQLDAVREALAQLGRS